MNNPCFIRKNSVELRNYLESLGYKLINTGGCTLDCHNYDGKGNHRSIEEGTTIITSLGYMYGVCYEIDSVTKNGRIDCGEDEELFKSISALKDDNDYMQYFTNGVEWYKCTCEDKFTEYIMGKYYVNLSNDWHKATVVELIEKFKK